MKRHPVLLLMWVATVGGFIAVVVRGNGDLVLLTQLAAILCGMLTVRNSEGPGVLRRPWLFRTAVVLLLAAAATSLVAAGSTAVVTLGGAHHKLSGFAALAVTNLVIAILAWRTLTRPSMRRTAIVGLLALVFEVAAIIVDVIMNMDSGVGMDNGTPAPARDPSQAIGIAMAASYVANWLGAFVCITALTAFDPADATDMPEARVVDES